MSNKRIKILRSPNSCIKDHFGAIACEYVCDNCYNTLSKMYKDKGYEVTRDKPKNP